ncbi:RNA polymerase [Western grey kangaroopox virus]|uniref:DNA-directed RNA polymerase 18 kDa subunit n=1 Tax=Western grey kangaroopox virus TaxID=1566307 RepID=A0A2C9DSP7_9POXV|nr:RNA polymerase [Western grey kangaroopox virus]ATI21030.1 RNA polymerase [Western grey kangaroopox virus]
MSSFSNNVYLPIVLEPHELNLDLRDNIRKAVMLRYLHKEITGFMPQEIIVREDREMPLGELVNNQIALKVPCHVTYKYYRVGDVVRGTLNITDESDISVNCGDLVCRLGKDAGTVSYDDSKYCFIRNGRVYADGAEVSVVLKEAQTGAESTFVFLATINEK